MGVVRPRLLDLFCGAGGAARGYHRAGFDVVGVDINPQPRYPFEFHQGDAMTFPLDGFDAIHASPPCPGYSRLRHLPWLKGREWPLLIPGTRDRVSASGVPWVIENVMDAPLDGPFLCGLMFGLPVYRHRRFESNAFMLAPGHPGHTVVIGHGRMVNDRRKGTLNAGSSAGAWGNQRIITVAGGQFSKADGERALGIDWMTKAGASGRHPARLHRMDRDSTAGDAPRDRRMTLPLPLSGRAETDRAVALDFALADGPDGADLAGLQGTSMDLLSQGVGGHAEGQGGFRERHLRLLAGDGVPGAMLAPLAPTDVSGRALGVEVTPLGRDGDGALHLGDEFGREAGLAKDLLGVGVHHVPFGVVIDGLTLLRRRSLVNPKSAVIR